MKAARLYFKEVVLLQTRRREEEVTRGHGSMPVRSRRRAVTRAAVAHVLPSKKAIGQRLLLRGNSQELGDGRFLTQTRAGPNVHASTSADLIQFTAHILPADPGQQRHRRVGLQRFSSHPKSPQSPSPCGPLAPQTWSSNNNNNNNNVTRRRHIAVISLARRTHTGAGGPGWAGRCRSAAW